MRKDVFGKKRRAHPLRWVALLLAGLLVAVGVWTAIDNGRVVVLTQRVLVTDLPKQLEGYTILLISDLNGKRFGPKQAQIAKALKNRAYNAVCLVGDMVGERGDPLPFYELLEALDTSRPAFYIAGDSDPAPIGGQEEGYYSVLADWINGAATRGAVYLSAPARVSVGNASVWFSDAAQLGLDLEGAEAAFSGSTAATATYQLKAVKDTIAARAQMRRSDLHILLSHRPLSGEWFETMAAYGGEAGDEFLRTADLIVAGGYVGGQWRLPFAGALYADGWLPEESAVRGYQYAENLLQYITGGLDVSASTPLPGFRLFNTPEVTLITFTAQIGDDVLP